MKKPIFPFVSTFRSVARKPLITGPAVASARFGVVARTQEKPMDLRRAFWSSMIRTQHAIFLDWNHNPSGWMRAVGRDVNPSGLRLAQPRQR